MARASGVAFEIAISTLPILPGARECLEQKILNRAHKTNWDYVQNEVRFTDKTDFSRSLVTDPQTSGGLLLSVPSARAEEIVKLLKIQFPATAIIGKVVAGNPQIIFNS